MIGNIEENRLRKLVEFYDRKGWDMSLALEFTVRQILLMPLEKRRCRNANNADAGTSTSDASTAAR